MAAQSLERPTLETLLGSRRITDSYIRGVWIALPTANYAVWSIIAIVEFLAFFEAVGIPEQLTVPLALLGSVGLLASAASSYFVYILINRRNVHFARQEALLARALESIKSSTSQDDMKTLFPLDSAEHNFLQISQASGEKSAVLWALLTLLPYVGGVILLYVLGFLSEDFKKHEVGEDLVTQDLDRTLKAMGSEGMPLKARRSSLAHRNTLAILVASILTLGLFELYWLYLAIKDPLPHFEYHQLFEDRLSKLFPDSLPAPRGL